MFDGRGYVLGQLHRREAVLAGHERPRALRRAGEETLQLRAQRLLLLDVDVDRLDGPAVQAVALDLLLLRVDGDVRLAGEEAHLAHALLRDAAGGEVGDGAVGELEADVRDVDLVGEHGDADGADLDDLLAEEGEDEVEIVDHQVEEDVDVERASDEDAEALGLDVADVAQQRRHRGDGGVVALDVADLDDAAVFLGEVDEALGVVDGVGDRLLDHDVAAGLDQRGADLA